MALPSQTLASIQAAGAAIYQADLALKEAVKRYSDLTQNAMLENPFDIGNNALFADWTTIARLSRAVSQVESEFVKIYTSASAMSDSTSPAVRKHPANTG